MKVAQISGSGSHILTRFIHDATTSSTVINCANYFDTGTVESTLALRVEKCKLVKFGGRLMKVLGPQMWNKLPNDIQESTSVDTFKKSVKTFYTNQYISWIDMRFFPLVFCRISIYKLCFKLRVFRNLSDCLSDH